MPARTARPDRGVPARLAAWRPFQTAKSRTSSLLYSSASTRSPTRCCVGSSVRQPAVGGPARDAEEDRAVVGAIGVAASISVPMSATISGMWSVARGSTSGTHAQPPQLGQERRRMRAVSSPMGMPAARASRMILSSTSVMFMTQRPGSPSSQVTAQPGPRTGSSGSCPRAPGRRPSGRSCTCARWPGRAARSPRTPPPSVLRNRSVIAARPPTCAVARMTRPAPSSPERLPVEALTATRRDRCPAAPTRSRASRPTVRPPSWGRAPTMVRSSETGRSRLRGASRATTDAAAPDCRFRGSGRRPAGNDRPMSPMPAAASSASHTAWSAASPSECPWSRGASGTSSPPVAGRPARTGGCRPPKPTRGRPVRRRDGAAPSARSVGQRDLEIAGLTGHDRDHRDAVRARISAHR